MSIRTKLLVAFLEIVAALIMLGGVGLGALGIANDRAARLAEQQARIDHYRHVSVLASQTLLIMGNAILFVDGGKYGADRGITTRPLPTLSNNGDWVQYEIANIKRKLRNAPPASPEVMSRFDKVLEELAALAAQSLILRRTLESGELEAAAVLYEGEASSLKGRIERETFTLMSEAAAEMQASAAESDAKFARSRQILILISGGAVLVALLLGYAISSSFTRPVRQIQDRLRELGGGDFSHRLSVANRDELGELAENVNRANEMLDDLYNRASAKTAEMERLSNQLSKYLSPQVYASIFEGRQEVKIAATRKKLTVFFSDIADFTETADRMESEELTQLLNHYLTEMSQIALDHGATVDKYIGDAIMIFFGDPETRGVREDARACVRMAIAMRERMVELQEVWREAGIARPLRCRMGVHTDFCTVGNFGSEDRLDYTIIGRGVNIASRLETLAAPGEILISCETYAQVDDEIDCAEKGEVEVKGLAYPVATYQVAGLRDADRDSGRGDSDWAKLVAKDPATLSEAERDAAIAHLSDALKSLTRSDGKADAAE